MRTSSPEYVSRPIEAEDIEEMKPLYVFLTGRWLGMFPIEHS